MQLMQKLKTNGFKWIAQDKTLIIFHGIHSASVQLFNWLFVIRSLISLRSFFRRALKAIKIKVKMSQSIDPAD